MILKKEKNKAAAIGNDSGTNSLETWRFREKDKAFILPCLHKLHAEITKKRSQLMRKEVLLYRRIPDNKWRRKERIWKSPLHDTKEILLTESSNFHGQVKHWGAKLMRNLITVLRAVTAWMHSQPHHHPKWDHQTICAPRAVQNESPSK